MPHSKIGPVTKWAATGRSEGSATRPGPPPSDADWALGETNLVIQTTEPCTIRAVGSGIYGNFPVRVPNHRGSEKPSR